MKSEVIFSYLSLISKIWNKFSLSSKDIIFFPSISSLIILILFKTAPIVCNKRGPESIWGVDEAVASVAER